MASGQQYAPHSRRRGFLIAASVALLSSACGSTSVEELSGPGTVRCAASLSADPTTVPAAGTTVSVTVSAARDCTWNARTDVSWMQARTTSGQGEASFAVTVGRNDLAGARSGGVIVNDQRLGITQEGQGCSIALSGSQTVVPATGDRRSVTVTTLAGCPWTAESSAPWLTLLTTAGTGAGSITFDVLANTGPAREATITVSGRTFLVSQQAAPTAPPCSFGIEPASLSFAVAGGNGSVAVTASQPSCAWTVENVASWVTVLDQSGTGSATVRYVVAANTSSSERRTTLTIAGRVHTITQQGVVCTFTLTPASSSYPPAGGTGAIDVSTLPGCSWTASSNGGWVTVGTISGSGPGTVGYTVQPNADAATRTTAIVIGGQTHTVSQAAAPPPCTYALDPASRSFASTSGSGTVRVNTGAACGWTATSSAAWITIAQNSLSGTGTADVSYTVAENTTTTVRTGTITIAGQTHTVTQAAAAVCTYTLDPTTRSFTSAAATGTVRVNTSAGCAWTAVSSAPWITVATASAAGSGSADVAYTVAANTTTVSRSGTITIGGQTHTITQMAATAACTYVLDPLTRSFTGTGGTGTVRVTTGPTCAWTAVSSEPWVVVVTPAGVGTFDITYTVGATTTSRTATITVNGQAHTVQQTVATAPAP